MKDIQTSLAISFLRVLVVATFLFGSFAQDAQSASANIASSVPPCKDPRGAPSPEHMTRPKYPREALKAGDQDTVELRALVDPNGKTRNLTVVKGEPIFTKPAMEAVRKWQFHPALVEGKPAETVYKVQVRFVLLLQEAVAHWEIESPPQNADTTTSNVATTLRRDTSDVPVYRVSDAEGVVAPKAIYSPEPELSERARIAGEGGTVTISLVVGVDGKPRNLKVECGSAPDLAEKAVEAITTWRFEPGTKDGKPVVVEIAVEVQFHLNDSY